MENRWQTYENHWKAKGKTYENPLEKHNKTKFITNKQKTEHKT